jgi:hypothetical protein
MKNLPLPRLDEANEFREKLLPLNKIEEDICTAFERK